MDHKLDNVLRLLNMVVKQNDAMVKQNAARLSKEEDV